MICQCGKAYRNWTTKEKRLICRCGSEVIMPASDGYNVQTEHHAIPAEVCSHRGAIAGRLSCACGSVYQCSLHAVVCSDRKPREEFYTITLNLVSGGSMQLDKVGYRCCGECDDNSTAKPLIIK